MTGKKQARIIFDAYRSGKLSPDTEANISAWFAKYGNYPGYVEALQDIWNETVAIDDDNMDAEAAGRFERYKAVLGFPEEYASETELIERIYAKNRRIRLRKTGPVWLWRAAAVAIPFLLLLGTIWYVSNPNEQVGELNLLTANTRTIPSEKIIVEDEQPVVLPDTPAETAKETKSTEANTPLEIVTYDTLVSVPVDGFRSVQLPDNSTVLLNGGGQLAFSTEKREASLVGEAYFKVEKAGSRPFRVKTEYLTIEVTGTEFSVDARPDAEPRVDLISGSVNVSVGTNKMKLKPLEALILTPANHLARVSAADQTGWWKEPLQFEGETLYEIFEKVEQYYDIRISGKEQILNTEPYTIKFDKMSTPAQILDVMMVYVPEYEYRQDGTRITIQKRETANHE